MKPIKKFSFNVFYYQIIEHLFDDFTDLYNMYEENMSNKEADNVVSDVFNMLDGLPFE
jgi:translation initiation factor IF-2